MNVEQAIKELLSENLEQADFDSLYKTLRKILESLSIQYERVLHYLVPEPFGLVFNLSSQYALIIKKHQLNKKELLQLKNLVESVFSFACLNTRQSELSRIENYLSATEDGYWDWDAESNTVYFSTTWKSMLGYEYDEIDNRFASWQSLLHPDDYQSANQKAQTFFSDPNQKYENEFRLRCKNGSYKWILARGKTIEKFKDGSPKRVVGTHVDIDHVKLLEQQLQNIENDLSINQQTVTLMGERARIGAWSFDVTNQELYWSNTVKEIHAVPKDYQPEVNSAINFYKEGWSRDRISQCVTRALEENIDYDEELIIIDANGNEKWVRALGKPSSFRNHVTLSGIFQDITEQKDLVSALESARAGAEEKSQRLSLAVHSAHIGFWDLDLVSNKLSWNDEMFSIYALDKSNFSYTFEDWSQYINSEDLIVARELIKKAIDGTANFDTEYRIIDGTNTPKKIKSNAEVIRDAVGQPLRLVGVNIDVTEQRAFEHEQQKIVQLAEEASKAKSQFLATMSHEIRTPLNGIIGMLDLLKHGGLEQEHKSQVIIAERSAHSLLDILNDILDLTKIESGKLEIEQIEFNLFDLLRAIIHTCQFKADNKDIRLNLDVNFDEHITVKSDSTRLRQVIINLIDNAIKFTHYGDVSVTCIITQKNETYELSVTVKDSGIGISDEQKDKLFRRFSQVDATTTRQYGGTGLGLSISKSFVELLDGTISFTSTRKIGSSFSFKIPLEEVLDSDLGNKFGNEKDTRLNIGVLSNKHVLIIDSSSDSRNILKHQLEQLSCRYLEASGYESALEQASIHSDSIEMVIADHSLGLGLIGKLRSISNLAIKPLIITSSVNNIISTQELNKFGLTRLLEKPISTQQLYKEVSKLVSNKNHEHIENDDATGKNIENCNSSQDQKVNITNIIIAEDNKVNQIVIKGYLSKLVENITITNNGQELLKRLKEDKSHYDLVIMDCEMPIMDGYEATEKIRAGVGGDDYSTIPIIALTANAFKEDRERCLQSGMNGFVAKPTTSEKLIKEILQHLVT